MKHRTSRGFSSVFVILFMSVSLILVLGLTAYTSQTMLRSKNEKDAMIAFQSAQAILEQQVAQSYEFAKTNNGLFKPEVKNFNTMLADLGNTITGTASVVTELDASRAWVTATVNVGGKSKSLRAHITTKDVSIWNNAIFAGTGASGQAINGNVDIRGSVHILGEGEPYSDLNGNGVRDDAEVFTDTNKNGVWDPGEPFVDRNNDGVWNSAEPFNDTNFNGVYDPPAKTTDLSSDFGGTAHIGNNYANMPSEVKDLVAAIPVINGLRTLGAEVRVKHGQIALSGNATAGSATNVENGLAKGKLDGTFVNDGWSGNAGAASVYSDNGTSNAYDLGHLKLKFPLISGIGAKPYTSGGQVYSTHKDFFDAKALTIPVNAINANTANFLYADANGNSITYTRPVVVNNKVITPAILQIMGIVKIQGNLSINGLSELRYTGRGTIYATQDIYVGTNLLPGLGKFPVDSVLGIVAGRNMGLATGNGDSQLKLAGAFYAQGTITSAKQNQIAGTFVANFFDMGKNVPNIYQVPALRLNMPPGMPGDEPVITLNIQSWRERK
ncbi:hypothetical protein QPK87_18600 [Kamptonema cortianum]|nr:hypothetical protein [Geitlerinema splendidum]MDK3158567.1 hypothetical protein [Kamptonema cortianum]